MSLSHSLSRWTCVLSLALFASGCADEAESAASESAASDVAESSESDTLIEEGPTEDASEVSEEVSEGLDEDTSSLNEEASEASEEGIEDEGAGSEAFADEVPESAEAFEPDAATPFAALSEAGDVVSFVEVDRYMGRWYEIATTPSFQQASCYATQADYSFNEAQGWVDVLNACRVGSTMGNWQQIAGRAELVDTNTQAKLNVIFFGQAAPYWVVALDGAEGEEPYQWAVVSVPGKQVIWLLSRTNQMDDALRAEIEAHLIERGYPIDTLVDTPHAM